LELDSILFHVLLTLENEQRLSKPGKFERIRNTYSRITCWRSGVGEKVEFEENVFQT
jgi:hypothetical protein